MDTNPFYINQKGEIIKYDDICSHIGIAVRYLDENPELKAEFERSGIRYATDFLIQKKGMIQVTNEEGNGYYNNKLVFSSSMMTLPQKGLIIQYMADGYRADDIDRVSSSIIKKFHGIDER